MSGSNYTSLCATAVVKNFSHCTAILLLNTSDLIRASVHIYTCIYTYGANTSVFNSGVSFSCSFRLPPRWILHEYGSRMSYAKRKKKKERQCNRVAVMCTRVDVFFSFPFSFFFFFWEGHKPGQRISESWPITWRNLVRSNSSWFCFSKFLIQLSLSKLSIAIVDTSAVR